jgi:hypothetical protein
MLLAEPRAGEPIRPIESRRGEELAFMGTERQLGLKSEEDSASGVAGHSPLVAAMAIAPLSQLEISRKRRLLRTLYGPGDRG